MITLADIQAMTPEAARAALDASLETTTPALGQYLGSDMAKAVMSAVTGATSFSLFTTLSAMGRIGPPDDPAGVVESVTMGLHQSWQEWLHNSHQMDPEGFVLIEKHLDVVAATVYHTLLEGIDILRARAAAPPQEPEEPEQPAPETVH